MPWQLSISPRATKDLAAMPPRDRTALSDALHRLLTDPSGVDLKKLAGQEGRWRVRVGRWRAILQLDHAAGEIRVMRVSPRSTAYRE